jgi:hypothetical protein
MSRNNRGKKSFSRNENTREERKVSSIRELLTFSFKDLDETQPSSLPETIKLWAEGGILECLFERLRDLSKLTRGEAEKQQQIKIYGDFPPKTDFFHPKHIDEHVAWGVIKAVGGQKGTVAGYIVENTFYVVFFDKHHRFWITEKKHT